MTSRATPTVIFVPGLGVNQRLVPLLVWWWKRWQIEIIEFQVAWKSRESYRDKLKRLLKLIDEKSKNGKVSLIGTSAGGSLVINALAKQGDKIAKVITVCARLKKGPITGFRGFEARSKGYPAFRESVTEAEKTGGSFTRNELDKILTVRALFDDELVPASTTTIDHAQSIAIPSGEHMLCIFLGLTVYGKRLVDFIDSIDSQRKTRG